ncbi:hypothetical protein ABE485_02555 [Achromobacter spanius]|uniref:hypothetical protein n=1 Tax=Achromobacter spanius TaxID=217203 RepID=UPI00320A7D92
MTENNAAQPGLTDDEIEALAKKHIAPHADRLEAIMTNPVPYQQTEQFRRVKALIADALSKLRAEGVQAGDERAAPIKRYYHGTDCMQETLSGDWVRYDDHVAVLESSHEAGMADAAFLIRWDTHAGEPDAVQPLTDADKVAFSRDALASAAVAGEAQEDLAPPKCPITGRPFFMALEHPELGLVPTYGGPYDSYTIPQLGGKADQPWHERELRVYRYDHDLGGWRTDEVEVIPLRIVHEDVLNERHDAAPQASEAVRNTALDDAVHVLWLMRSRPEFEPDAKDRQLDRAMASIRALKTQADKDGAQPPANRPESRASIDSKGGALDGGDCAKGAGKWPMLSELHLHALMFAYNEGYSKAYDGRVFPNPFSENGSQAAAWQLGTDDGTEARAALSAQPGAQKFPDNLRRPLDYIDPTDEQTQGDSNA